MAHLIRSEDTSDRRNIDGRERPLIISCRYVGVVAMGVLAELVAEANRVIAAQLAKRAMPPRYTTAHNRLRRDRGPAASQQCIDCDGPAAEWSYAHERATERLVDPHMPGSPFSLAATDYDPRCRRCHARYDQSHGKVYAHRRVVLPRRYSRAS